MTGIVSLLVFAAIVAAAAMFGSLYLPGAWYEGLVKPSWTPPSWLFGPVWGALYIMIAIAGWRVWRASGVSAGLAVWLVNVAANGMWSYLMFGRKAIGYALLDISAIWLTIVLFIGLAWRKDGAAALLFVPYLVWVSYAAALNFEIWRLNP